MKPSTACDPQHLLAFNQQVLEQALALVSEYQGTFQRGYASPVGAHLRHLIEHYEALLGAWCPSGGGAPADYDSRARERALETDPAFARRRLLALQQGLAGLDAAACDTPVAVRGLIGLAGENSFQVASSLGRELAFLASHAVHHFALLVDHCQRQQIPLPKDFGKAPATVAHHRSQRSTSVPSLDHPTEFPCHA
jgi:hypothetical protein